jgi:hypothetical protein
MIVTELPVDYFQDPLKYFARMREKRPVTPVTMPEGNRAWMITRYARCVPRSPTRGWPRTGSAS